MREWKFCSCFDNFPSVLWILDLFTWKDVLKKCELVGFDKIQLWSSRRHRPGGPEARVPPSPCHSDRDLPENLGYMPTWSRASVSPHSLPLNTEDLERYKDLWALKSQVCKIGYLWWQCYPSKRIKYTKNSATASVMGEIVCYVSIIVTYYL